METNQPIVTKADLQDAIRQLEVKRDEQAMLLRVQFKATYESVKPINLIKSTFREVTSSGELKDNVIGTTVGLAAGFLSKVLFVGFSSNPLRKLAGSLLMFGVTNLVTRNGVSPGSLGRRLLTGLFHKKDNSDNNLPSGDIK